MNLVGQLLMAWICFSFMGEDSLAFIKTKRNSEAYEEIFKDHLFPNTVDFVGANRIFLQDNAPIHKLVYENLV